MMAHPGDPRTQGVEVGGLGVQGQPWLYIGMISLRTAKTTGDLVSKT